MLEKIKKIFKSDYDSTATTDGELNPSNGYTLTTMKKKPFYPYNWTDKFESEDPAGTRNAKQEE